MFPDVRGTSSRVVAPGATGSFQRGKIMRKWIHAAAIAGLGILGVSARAEPFVTTLPDQVLIAGSYYVGFVTSPGTSVAGAAQLTFELVGYGNVDGFGPRISGNDVYDNFDFRVNDPGVDGVSFGAILNLGGSYPGTPIVYDTNPETNGLGATLDVYQDNGFNLGGSAHFTVAFTLREGANDFAFNFALNPGAGEGWGLRDIVISADVAAPPVPEPPASALWLAGLAATAGVVVRRRGRRDGPHGTGAPART